MDSQIEPSSRAPRYLVLADEIHGLIKDRSLRPGQRLPSVRRTAHQRQLSVGTVVQAYVLLENRGVVEARPKSGYYVRPPALTAAATASKPIRRDPEDLVGHMMDVAHDARYFPLGTAWPDARLFPLEKLAQITATAARAEPGLFARHPMDYSHRPLTQELSRRYLLAGASIGHEEFLITSGCMEALHLSLAACTRPGDVVALECPTYFGFLRILTALGLKGVEIPVHPRHGLSLEALSVALDHHPIRALVVTPSHHNPTGACMSNARKGELYSLLVDHDLIAVEDDIYGDLHFGPVRPKPLKAWDREGRVLLCSSLSKTVGAGLGVGWVTPGRLRQRLDALKWSTTPALTQQIAARFLREAYDRHVRQLRHAFAAQVAATREAVARYFPPGTMALPPSGGLVLWVQLPPGVDSLRLRSAALQESIGTAPGPIFSLRDQFRNFLRLNCGLPWSAETDKAIRTLGRLAGTQLAA